MWVETVGHYYDLDWLREDAADYFSEGEVREECLDKNTFFMKLVSEEGEIIGCVQAFKKNETMVLSRFYLHATIRGQGIGARLLKQAIEFCKPIKKARLIVEEHNERGIAFYERHGFKKVGVEPYLVVIEKVFLD